VCQRQQQEEEQRIAGDLGMDDDDEDSSDSWCEDMTDCNDSRRVVDHLSMVENRPPPLKRQKLA